MISYGNFSINCNIGLRYFNHQTNVPYSNNFIIRIKIVNLDIPILHIFISFLCRYVTRVTDSSSEMLLLLELLPNLLIRYSVCICVV